MNKVGIFTVPMAADEGEEEVDLNHELWCMLPDDPLERVISRLPLASLLRAKSVCRGWNMIIQSKQFIRMYTETCKQEPWLLIFPHDDASAGLAYDPSLKRWQNMSFKFLPFDSRVMATSHGLICMFSKSSHHKLWLICNPVSKAWISIPCPASVFKLFFLAVGLFAEEEKGGTSTFKVVMAGSELVAEDSEQFNLATEVYDSRLGYWKKGGNLFLDAPLSPWRATCKGVMYCVTGYSPFRIFGYESNRGEWFEVKAQLPEKVISLRLIDYNGVLLMVGGVGGNNIIVTIGMWTLNATCTRWTEYGWMPPAFCYGLLQTRIGRFVCIGQCNVLYFGNKRCSGILMHNLLTKSWQWITGNPLSVNIHYHMSRGFHFSPSLRSC